MEHAYVREKYCGSWNDWRRYTPLEGEILFLINVQMNARPSPAYRGCHSLMALRRGKRPGSDVNIVIGRLRSVKTENLRNHDRAGGGTNDGRAIYTRADRADRTS